MDAFTRPVLGFDIGGTKLAAAVIEPDGSARGFVVEPTFRNDGWQPIVRRLFAMGRRAIDQAGTSVAAVGIACGGPLDPFSGTLIAPPHLPGWRNVPIARLAQDAFAAPAALQNDATAAALGEHRYGKGSGAETLLYLTISTGIGGGAVVDGRLHLGKSGNAAEFGHVAAVRGGRLCSCGRRGCIEAYASGSSITERAREAGLTVKNAADVVRKAIDGDLTARRIWDETTDLLGGAITDLVNAFEPDVVVLGGGVTRAGATLLDPVRAIVTSEALVRVPQIEITALGDQVGVVGAGAVAQEYARAVAHA
jgi:glucokinase